MGSCAVVCMMHTSPVNIIVPVPTDLGLRPAGVRSAPRALLAAGLADVPGIQVLEAVTVPEFDPQRDRRWGVPNIDAVATVARAQADVVASVLERGDFPVVLGGDDSVMFGCLLGAHRLGAPGLLFIDGHTDFWDPRDGDGELSDSDLFIAVGGGPKRLSRLAGDVPLVTAERCVVYGHRDRESQLLHGSQDVYRTPMLVRSLAEIRAVEATTAGTHAAAWLSSLGARRTWLHLDVDCLSDDLVPAVDWRLPGGLLPDEVVELVAPAAQQGLLAGMDVTIYNPELDADGTAAGVVVDVVRRILAIVDGHS